MDRIAFHIFSGTGNTLLAARAMAEVFDSAGVHVESHWMPNDDPPPPSSNSAALFAFPVYEQTIPKFIYRYIESLPAPREETDAYVLTTLADFSGLVKTPAWRLLKRKGFAPRGIREVKMPSNFIYHGTEQKNAAKTLRGLDNAAEFAQAILKGEARWPRPSILPTMLFPAARLGGTVFTKVLSRLHPIPDKCSKCGLCEKLCPTGNIAMNDDGPKWDGECQLCLRCVAFCPHNAIRAKFGDFLFHPRYNAGGVKAVDLLASSPPVKPTPNKPPATRRKLGAS